MTGRTACPGIVAALLLGAGCRVVEPPSCAVANLYPVVQPAKVLESSVPCGLTRETLRRRLEACGLGPYLEETYLPDFEWETLVRSLQARGYAEIDARRSPGTLRYVCIQSLDGRRLLLTIELRPDNPGLAIGPRRLDLKTPSTRRTDACEIHTARRPVPGIPPSQYPCLVRIRES